jgi:hypothetical protein
MPENRHQARLESWPEPQPISPPESLAESLPEQLPESLPGALPESLLVIACGALAREIRALKRTLGWGHLQLQCMDPLLHNQPHKIPQALRRQIQRNKGQFDRIFVAYADCGTAGAIDRVLAEEGIERLPGAHCYQFFAGAERFEALAEEEPGTFYLTDFLARHFDRLVIEALKIDQHPELKDLYFAHYQRLVYLSQSHDSNLLAKAQAAAQQLGLRFQQQHAGYGELEAKLISFVQAGAHGQENHHLLA